MALGKRKISGFTLIELLIVVAIIAILAAIAVPNFLEAQMRSKVAACWSDMRTTAVALESYMVDTNKYPMTSEPASVYPNSPFNQIGGGSFAYAGRISTPIAYITRPPIDRLTTPLYERRAAEGFAFFEYWSDTPQKRSDGGVSGGLPGPKTGANRNIFWNVFNDSTMYLLWSYGPDRTPSVAGVPDGTWLAFGIENIYDPSNGTISSGNLYFAGPGSQIPGGR